MNKTSKKQKGYKKRPDKIKNENSGDIKKPEHSSSDTALVKFDPLQRYLAEISKYKLLTREQEIELGKRVTGRGRHRGCLRFSNRQPKACGEDCA